MERSRASQPPKGGSGGPNGAVAMLERLVKMVLRALADKGLNPATGVFSPTSSVVNDKKNSGLVVGASVRSVDCQMHRSEERGGNES